jgi:hypothetical protein
VTGSGYGTGRIWRTFAGDGSGRFHPIWENPLAGQTGDGVLIDLDGDGHLDLIEQYGIAVHRGDGTGGFLPAAVFLAPADQFTLARSRHAGPIDVIALDRDPIVGGFVTAPQLGTIPAADLSPPEPALIVRPVVHEAPSGRPAFENHWTLAATAFDDCRSARVTAQRIDLLPTTDDAPLTMHFGDRDEIRIYEFPSTAAREVHLFGPDEQAIRERFVRARLQGGFTLEQNVALAILTSDRFGATAGAADEPAPVIPNVQLTQRFVFDEGRLVRVEVHRPGGDLTATVEATDEVGRTAATSLRFGAARAAYCGAPGAERIACEE